MVSLIRRRRTVRTGFRESGADPETIRRVVGSGLLAPSAKNSQPWRLHVISDRQLLGHLATLVRQAERIDNYVPHDPKTGGPRNYRSTVEDSAIILESVSFAVLVENIGPFSGGPQVLLAATSQALTASLFGYGEEWFAIGASVENMWLTAIALGMSGAFLADVAVAEAEWRSLLGFEGELVGALAIGFSDADTGPNCDPPYREELGRVVWH